MNIYVLAPYSEQILNGLLRIKESDDSINYVLIGDKKKIETFNNNQFEIIDIEEENEIIAYVKKNINCFAYIIGCLSEDCKEQILNDNYLDHGLINILKSKYFDNYIFVSTNMENEHMYFENKKRSILNGYEFMSKLGIKKSNVALVYTGITKKDILEANIIKMIGQKYKNLKIFDVKTLSDILMKKEMLINMLIFKNIDVCKMFLETLTLFSDFTIGSINYCKKNGNKINYYIDCNNFNEKDFVFSVLILLKILKYEYEKVIMLA